MLPKKWKFSRNADGCFQQHFKSNSIPNKDRWISVLIFAVFVIENMEEYVVVNI